MLQSALLAITLFVGNPLTHVAEPEAPASAPAAAHAPATQPAPQPSVAQAGTAQAADASKDEITSIGAVFGKTKVAQLVEGKKQVTLAEVRDPAFWLDTIRDLLVAAVAFIPRVIVAFLFLVFFWCVYRGVRRLVLGSLSAAHVDPSIRDMLGHLLKWSIMGFGIVIACNQIGIQIAALLTGVSIIGLAVGFAAQETLANFIAGIVIFWDKPFKLGDWVEIDGTYAEVQRVTFRSTRLLDGAGHVVIFPNTHMLSKKLANHTSYPVTRVRVDIGIAYKESIQAAREVLLGILKGDDRIDTEHEPSVGVVSCSASSVDLALCFWVKDEGLERKMKGEYLEKAKNALDAAGIQIPFPHMQVFVEQTPAIEQLATAPMQLRRAG
jgi:small conductance mechanosensitive channel